MKQVKLLSILAITALFLSSCKDSTDHDPYITFWDANGKWIETTENIPVQLNSTYILKSEIAYDESPLYEWKTGDEEFKPFSAADGLNITTTGTYNGMGFQKATWTLNFSDEIYESGSTVTIQLSDLAELSRSLTFQVK